MNQIQLETIFMKQIDDIIIQSIREYNKYEIFQCLQDNTNNKIEMSYADIRNCIYILYKNYVVVIKNVSFFINTTNKFSICYPKLVKLPNYNLYDWNNNNQNEEQEYLTETKPLKRTNHIYNYIEYNYVPLNIKEIIPEPDTNGDNSDYYTIQEISAGIIEDLYKLSGIRITENKFYNFLEKAGFKIYNFHNFVRISTIKEVLNKLISIKDDTDNDIECCICKRDDNITISRCCINFYCDNCIMKLNKCVICYKKF
jgi:hypothetical protein